MIDPTKKASMIDNLKKAGYITKNTSDVESVVREHFLKDYIEANPNIKSGILNRQKSGLYQDYGIELSDDGNLDYSKGLLKQQSDLIKNYNYTKTTTGKDYQSDSTFMQRAGWRREDEAARKVNQAALLLENGKNVNSNFDTSETVRYHFKNELQDIMTGLMPKGAKSGYTEEYFNKNFAGKGNLEMYKSMKTGLEKGIKANPKSVNLRTALQKLELQKKRYDEGMNATYAQLGSYGVDAKTIDAIKEKTNTVVKSNFNSLKMTFPGVNIIKNGKAIPAKNIRPESLYNQELILDNGLKIRVKSTAYEDKSNILYLPENTPSNMLNKSDTNINVRFSYEVYDEKLKSWKQPSETDPYFKLTRNAFLNNETEIGLNGSLK